MDKFILSRHGEHTGGLTPLENRSQEFSDLTKEGERQTRLQADQVAEEIRNLPGRSIVILGGVSDAVRTRSTLEVYEDELRKIFGNDKDVLFPPYNKELLDDPPVPGKIYLRYLRSKLEQISSVRDSLNQPENVHKKAIIQFPLWLKQFTASPEQWLEWKSYFDMIKNIPPDKEIAHWFETGIGPKPKAVAEGLMMGLIRQSRFYRKFFPDNDLLFINVDHSGELDALFTMLANQGLVNDAGFDKIGGAEIKTSEIGQLQFLQDGRIIFKYRDKQYIYNQEDTDILRD